MTRRLAAWVLGGLAVLSVVATVVAQAITPPRWFDASAAIMFTAAVASFAGVGAFLALRVPANRVGWLLLASGVLFAVQNLCAGYAYANVAAGTTDGLTALVALLSNALFIPPIVIAAAAVPLVFPDGHLPSPRWSWLAWLLVIGTTLATLTPLLTPGPVNETPSLPNPLGSEVLAPYLPIADLLSTLSAIPAFAGAFAAVAVRFRRGTLAERQQIKWLLAAALVGAIAFPTAFVIGAFGGAGALGDLVMYVGFMSLIALPVAIAVAVLRYRLYEIDRLISRTIGWAIVTGVLVGVFALVVVGLQGALAGFTDGQTLAVAASTLVAFALFQPVRRRVQHAVDRRFDRSRYDGERVVAAFAARLRDQVDLGNLEAEIRRIAVETVRPTSSAVWLSSVHDTGARRVS